MKSSFLQFALVWSGLGLFALPAVADSKWTTNSGYWTNGAIWNGGTVPAATDDVAIAFGHTVTNTGSTPLAVNSLSVTGTLTHAANSNNDVHHLEIAATNYIYISTNGAINVTGKGYAGGTNYIRGYGPGGGGASGSVSGKGNGGGHGGQGGYGYVATGIRGGVYGSATNPVDLGSGGGGTLQAGADGGAGGGMVKLTASNVTVNGSLAADGVPGINNAAYTGGSGAGGSIWIRTGVLDGNGAISARGGAGNNGNGGAGGGGRIAFFYTNNTFTGILRAYGGTNSNTGTGGAGPIISQQGTNPPVLLIDNNLAAGMVGTAATWMANSTLNAMSAITIRNFGMLSHSSGVPMDITIPTITIESNGFINVTGQGYAGGTNNAYGQGPGGGCYGTAVNSSGSGGGNGGQGGYGSDAAARPGEPYGSITNPIDLGSGGGGTLLVGADGGAGGGAIKLTVTNLTVNGRIIADGLPGLPPVGSYVGGSGAGGSIWITVANLTGTGAIWARGGPGYNGTGGGGGGGRIALFYATNTFSGSLLACGGSNTVDSMGGAGTIFTIQGTNPPDLLIDNNLAASMIGTAGTWAANAVLSSMNTITIRNYGMLTQTSGAPIDITVPSLTIASNGFINVTGLGYRGGTSYVDGVGPGGGKKSNTATIGEGGGAGYGGAGGTGVVTAAGATYGSISAPTNFGSGGGGTLQPGADGSAGGGAVKLTVNNFLFDGTIIADGVPGIHPVGVSYVGGSGAGGSVWIVAYQFTGRGTIRANGGRGTSNGSNYSGGGGGGRIAVWAVRSPFYTTGLRCVASGGFAGGGGSDGSPGTVYFDFKTRGTVLSTW